MVVTYLDACIFICILFKIYFFLWKEHTCFSPVQWDPANPDVQEH